MNITTAINHQNRLLSHLISAHNMSVTFKVDHMKYIDNKNKAVYQDNAWKRVPRHVREFINGYGRALWSEMERLNTVWILPYDGVNYLKWDELPEAGKEKYRKNELTGKHVYKIDMLSNW